MLSFEQAITKILENKIRIPSEAIRIQDACGRVCADEIISGCNIPEFRDSAMDGYALKSKSTLGCSDASGKHFKVVSLVKAGKCFEFDFKDDEVVKIMTGACVPDSADAVIKVEDTKRAPDNSVVILKEMTENENIRNAGSNIQQGDVVLAKGQRIKPSHLGLLAAINVDSVCVYQKPKVGIISTGDELVKKGDPKGKGKIFNVNSLTLGSRLETLGCEIIDFGIVPDNKEQIKTLIQKSVDVSDILITTGGVSMGDYDFVKSALEDLGADIKFWKIAMKPGKPVVFADLKSVPIFGLPGNPVSCFVGVEMLVKPFINRALGLLDVDNPTVDAYLLHDIIKEDKRMHFDRAITIWENGRYVTKTTGLQNSNILQSLAKANSLIIVDENITFLGKGAIVKVVMLD